MLSGHEWTFDHDDFWGSAGHEHLTCTTCKKLGLVKFLLSSVSTLASSVYWAMTATLLQKISASFRLCLFIIDLIILAQGRDGWMGFSLNVLKVLKKMRMQGISYHLCFSDCTTLFLRGRTLLRFHSHLGSIF